MADTQAHHQKRSGPTDQRLTNQTDDEVKTCKTAPHEQGNKIDEAGNRPSTGHV